MINARHAAALLLIAIGTGLPVGVQAQEPGEATRWLEGGVAALRTEHWDEAAAQLATAASASAESDQSTAARAEFYLGSLYQTRAARAADPAARQNDLLTAAEHYERALRVLPRSGPTLNNLARVRGELGDAAAAGELLDRALGLKDGKEAAYLRTRADLADQRNALPTERLALWQAAFGATPEDGDALKAFVLVALQSGPDALIDMTRSLIEHGSVEAAEALLCEALPSPAAPRSALLPLLADARAAQNYDPRSFDSTAIAAVLRALEADVEVGAGAREFRSLHREPSADRAAYPWWTRDYRDYAPLDAAGRVASLRRLALALSDWYRKQGSGAALKLAQPYAELALALSGRSADPKAALQLADIYANTDQRDRLVTMSNQYASKLFEGKGDAYDAGDREQIYEYHLALGAIFGYLGQWENPAWQPASAIFQLERARSTAESLNATLPPASERRITVPPLAVDLLSHGYLAVGRPDDSAAVRINSAKVYEAQGKPGLQRAVLQAPEGAIAVTRAQSPATQRQWNQARLAAQLPVAAPPAEMSPLEVGVNRQGGDLAGGIQLDNADQCSARCNALDNCRAMTFVKHAGAAGGVCWLKGSVPEPSANPAMTSAVKRP